MPPTPADRITLPSAGEIAERLVAPRGPATQAPRGIRMAGVLLLLFDVDGEPHTILTRRSDDLSHHPGQVSLPGGRYEPSDGDLATTALRETHEEIGIAPEAVRIVRQLSSVHTRVSSFLVTPFVGVATGPIEPVPCDREIARVMQVSIADILAADARLPRFPTIATLRYPLDNEDVWGATARILSDFTRVLRRVLAAP
jgi:8-oxo-dGTP pyrophosphatase MutT (NUDIX family)